MTRLFRVLVVLVVAVAAVGVLTVGRFTPEREVAAPNVSRVAPTSTPTDAAASTWFCAAGTATGASSGMAEQSLVITNPSPDAVTASVTASTDDATTATIEVAIDAYSRVPVPVADVVTGDWAGALVEVAAGAVAVEHVLTGPSGVTSGPCASSASNQWHLPVGSTELGVDNIVVLFNPFAQLAVVDLMVFTDDGSRTVPEFQGLLVEPNSVRVVTLSDVVTVRENVAVTATTRTGLVVAERLEVTTADADRPRSLAVSLGAPVAAGSWYFPGEVEVTDGVELSFVVFNPGDDVAEVDVQLLVDDPAVGFVEPFEVSVRPGQFTVVGAADDNRVPDGAAVAAYVESRNGIDVVAAEVVRTTGASPYGPGASLSVGSPVLATTWVVPRAGVRASAGVQLGITNLGVRDSDVTIELVADGEVVAGDPQPLTVAAGTRAVINVNDLAGFDDIDDPGSLSVVVTSTQPVAVGRVVQFANNRGFSVASAIVGLATGSWPPLAQPEISTPPTVVLDGILDDEPAPDEPDDEPDDTTDNTTDNEE